MKTLLLFLYILGTTAAIPTKTVFLSDNYNPTAETLVTPDDTAVPVIRVETAENETEAAGATENHPNDKADKPSVLKLEEETHEQSSEQDNTYSHELGLKDQEDIDGDLSVNLEYAPTEGTLDLKEDASEPQQKNLPENTDFSTAAVSSFVGPNQNENITKEEESQEQPVNDSHQLNTNSTHSQHLMDEESQEQDPGIANGEEEEKGPGEAAIPSDNQDKEELPKEHSNSKQEEDGDQSDAILEESNQPTQISKMQKIGSEQENQEEEDDSNAEVKEDSASSSKKHIQHTEQQSQEGKTGLEVTGDQKDMDEKGVLVEPTDDGTITPRNHGADEGGNDGSKHSSSDDYFMPSQEFLDAERMHSLSYYLKYGEEATDEVENGDTSETGDHQGAKKAESSSNEDGTLHEGNGKQHSMDSCVNFQCKRGHTCKADQQGKPHCVCQDPETCPPAKILDQVCGTDNQTYASSCHLFATKCKLEGTKKGHQLQLDYFGACKSIPACTDFEVAQFPLRMRDWLKNILMQLYEPNPKHDGYLNEKQRSKVKKIYLDEKRLLAGDHPIELLLRDFKKNYHMYVYPVHWQFNELDQHPADRILTHSELAPLRASLVPMEHCITRFFEECDPNKDKHITLKEWGHCFGIKEEDIDENLLF
ncbi:SPARC-like protein 1 isoform X2 [Nannospalax galili]|nr:SPARC-like protein 1 isoform X2 [Nannospalax galili]